MARARRRFQSPWAKNRVWAVPGSRPGSAAAAAPRRRPLPSPIRGAGKPGGDARGAGFDMEIEETGVALPAGAGQDRTGMNLVEPLVGGEADIAIDAEDGAARVAKERYRLLAQAIAERGDELAERGQHI